MYKQEDSKTTPFIPLFLECLEKSTINIEKKMLKDLIEFNPFSTKITVREFIENGKNLENIQIPENDLKQYWRMHESHKDKCIQENSDFISPVLYDNTDLEIEQNFGNKDIKQYAEHSHTFYHDFRFSLFLKRDTSFSCYRL